jgi:hypothetical protein
VGLVASTRNSLDLVWRKPDGDELRDTSVLTEDAHRRVPSVDETRAYLHDPTEDRLELEAPTHVQDRVKQALSLVSPC